MFICAGGSVAAFIGGSVLEIMLGRFLIQMIMSFTWWFVKTPDGFHHWYGDEGSEIKIWIHGALYWVLIFGWYRGLELVPIGDAEAIVFLAPVLIVILGRLVLKEPLSYVFPGTIFLTLAGILFVCQPAFIFQNVASRAVPLNGIMFLVIMAISWACASTLVRSAQKAHWLQITVVATLEGTLIWTPLALLINSITNNDAISGGAWIPLTWENAGLICLCAIFASAGLALNVIGYQIGEATKVAWMEYMDLIFAFAFQWLMFGRSPNLWEWLGCLCLMSTCALHLIEEAIKLRKSEQELEILEATSIETYASAIAAEI
jgi:drug/metabolite transporter (DMT)-like permease